MHKQHNKHARCPELSASPCYEYSQSTRLHIVNRLGVTLCTLPLYPVALSAWVPVIGRKQLRLPLQRHHLREVLLGAHG
jgi:hypothetical protein